LKNATITIRCEKDVEQKFKDFSYLSKKSHGDLLKELLESYGQANKELLKKYYKLNNFY